jgi:hypothetical protein
MRAMLTQIRLEDELEPAVGQRTQGVEVRSMKMIAAMQARSETVRGRAAARVGGRRWRQGPMRCHSTALEDS